MLVVASGAFSLFSRAAISSGVGTGLFVMKCVTDAEKKSSTRWVIHLVTKLYVRTMDIKALTAPSCCTRFDRIVFAGGSMESK